MFWHGFGFGGLFLGCVWEIELWYFSSISCTFLCSRQSDDGWLDVSFICGAGILGREKGSTLGDTLRTHDRHDSKHSFHQSRHYTIMDTMKVGPGSILLRAESVSTGRASACAADKTDGTDCIRQTENDR